MNLTDKDRSFLRSKRIPSTSFKILLTVLAVTVSLAFMALSVMEFTGNGENPFDNIYLHVLFPCIYFGVIMLISLLANRKINLDLKYNRKETFIRILKDSEYNRRMPYSLSAPGIKRHIAGHLSEYIFTFDDGSKYITNIPEEDKPRIDSQYRVYVTPESKTILDIELIN